MLQFPDWGLASVSWFIYCQLSLIHHCSEYWLSILIFNVQRTSMSFKFCFGALEDTWGSWLGFVSGSWFGYGYWSLKHQCSKFWIPFLILKVQRTSMSFKFWFGDCEDTGGSWLGFGLLILIWIWLLVFDIPMIWILALYLDFEGAKNIHVL